MKRLSFFILILTGVSCSKESVSSVSGCILTEIEGSNNFSEFYYYNSSNKMIKQIYNNNSLSDTSFYSYNSSGNLDTLSGGEGDFSLSTYSSDGKLKTDYGVPENPGDIFGTDTYFWYADSVVISKQYSNSNFPYQLNKYIIFGENITQLSYIAFQDEVLSWIDVIQYSNFDTGLNPYYIANLKRPGFGDVESKNNPGLTTETLTLYTNGVAGTPDVTTHTSTYTYNSSNAVTGRIDTYSNYTRNYTFIYSNCK